MGRHVYPREGSRNEAGVWDAGGHGSTGYVLGYEEGRNEAGVWDAGGPDRERDAVHQVVGAAMRPASGTPEDRQGALFHGALYVAAMRPASGTPEDGARGGRT